MAILLLLTSGFDYIYLTATWLLSCFVFDFRAELESYQHAVCGIRPPSHRWDQKTVNQLNFTFNQ